MPIAREKLENLIKVCGFSTFCDKNLTVVYIIWCFPSAFEGKNISWGDMRAYIFPPESPKVMPITRQKLENLIKVHVFFTFCPKNLTVVYSIYRKVDFWVISHILGPHALTLMIRNSSAAASARAPEEPPQELRPPLDSGHISWGSLIPHPGAGNYHHH